ncbi:MAG TPA: hypothetical protein DD733_07820 [Clostridiales bacterium]|mgnify:FL=1|nr:accessory gene regulator B family protein [Eubacteriales bacterium]HBR31975.1 hypothetical protein [Clostridiales bacterium]
MEEIVRNLANKIGLNLSYDKEKIDVIAYGLTAIVQMLMIFLIVSVIGIFFNTWFESFIIFILVGLLRKSTGGAHNATFMGCLIYSIFFISIMALLSRYLANDCLVIFYAVFSGIIFVWALYITYKKVPVDSPNKPISKKTTIKRLRRNSFLTLVLYAISTAILFVFSDINIRYVSFALSISISVLWQTFMLTDIGDRFIKIIDCKMVDF